MSSLPRDEDGTGVVHTENQSGSIPEELHHIQAPVDADECPQFSLGVLGKQCRIISPSPRPEKEGGHGIRLESKSVNVEFRDITMLAGDMGVVQQDIPANFPDRDKSVLGRVFGDLEKYHLVFCDGQVLRTHQRSEWRQGREATRLTVTQLTLSLQQLSKGGTMVILMHKLDSWRSFDLIYQFSKIAKVSLFKHSRHHKMRSSFYLVAQAVEAESPYAKSLVDEWKRRYKIAAFGSEDEYVEMHRVSKEVAERKVEEFGAEYVKMGTKIWKMPADGLENARFMKGATTRG